MRASGVAKARPASFDVGLIDDAREGIALKLPPAANYDPGLLVTGGNDPGPRPPVAFSPVNGAFFQELLRKSIRCGSGSVEVVVAHSPAEKPP
jgi:hypothetical protein